MDFLREEVETRFPSDGFEGQNGRLHCPYCAWGRKLSPPECYGTHFLAYKGHHMVPKQNCVWRGDNPHYQIHAVELFFCRPYCLRRYPQEKLGWALVKHRFHFCQTRIQAADKDSLQIRFACQLFRLDLYLQG